ncbi:probable WRKY transcription factor 51 [Ziziphus jujuba]|uniref:Probable WRKY transcription factor 51 n=1 Tax=Ziziphus jujuba TaxID=326968 RepID=A0A6P3YZ55_ZIZJJ|nr:probable WRKY transcription factor 51 [Ziziphus jujuba]
MDFPVNPNPNYTAQFDPLMMMDFGLEVEDYLKDDDDDDGLGRGGDWRVEQDCSSAEIFAGGSSTTGSSAATATSRSSDIKCKNGVKKNKVYGGQRVAFRTKSELEVMDDGYKWRKYGKKSVKNSPNPRNYYKCSSGGCNVKKRVERDGKDSSYVITTYDGVHNHESPAAVYYTQMPVMAPNGWSLQPSSRSSSSS